MVSGPINCVKYLVFIFNLIFFLFGITLVAVGAYVQTQLSAYLDFLSTNINGPAILLIIVGLIIFLVSFFGCCGAVKENYCMVLTFSILMMVLLVCQIGGAIAGFVYSNDIKQLVTTQMKKSMVNYDDPEKGGVTKTWDTVQTKWHCCGTDNPDDWTTAQPDKFDKAYPKSCCDDQIETCDSSSSTLNKQKKKEMAALKTSVHGCEYAELTFSNNDKCLSCWGN
ncbi:hypothetical protein EB796_012184 [Bugula neritina]|uniref:Tetraspanin n=1 Tax=Bugula neritina TaxID=10212 RepID=A0A7J7JU68_BUGNE|nr:hypothetical protein EB796_012184 [Bugula neritina]